MTLTPVTLTALLAAILGATAMVELCTALPGPDAAPPILVTPAPAEASADVSANAAAWSQTILQRPLFRPDRRPLAPDAAVAVPLPRLSAIVITATRAIAIFSRDDGNTVAVPLGGTIDGNRVAAITPGAVRLTGADGSHILHPQFGPSAPPGTIPPLIIPAQHFLDNN